MNKYGRLAMNHWKEVDPDRYAQIPNPQEFFSNLGEQVETQVFDLAYQIAGSDTKGEGFFEKVGRINNSRMRAEEIVLADLVWITSPEDDDDETPSQWGQDEVARIQQENDDLMEQWSKETEPKQQ